MCELFGWSLGGPVKVSELPLEPFFDRGGKTGNHDDGWGVALYMGGKNAVLMKDAFPASKSDLAQHLLLNEQLETSLGIAHIRYATNGMIHSGNAHPFVREFLGHDWSFAHNGVVPTAFKLISVGDRFVPTGTTDSEHLFCFIMNSLAKIFVAMPKRNDAEGMAKLYKEIGKAAKIAGAGGGRFNMLLSNGIDLFAKRDDRLSYVETQIQIDKYFHNVTYVATSSLPLSNKNTNPKKSWELDVKGKMWVIRDGSLHHIEVL